MKAFFKRYGMAIGAAVFVTVMLILLNGCAAAPDSTAKLIETNSQLAGDNGKLIGALWWFGLAALLFVIGWGYGKYHDWRMESYKRGLKRGKRKAAK